METAELERLFRAIRRSMAIALLGGAVSCASIDDEGLVALASPELETGKVGFTDTSSFSDTHLIASSPHSTAGGGAVNGFLSAANRLLLDLDPAEITAVVGSQQVLSARLILTGDGCDTGSVALHAMADEFEEATASWSCREDAGSSCFQAWSGSWSGPTYPYRAEATDTFDCEHSYGESELLRPDQIAFDVTADVLAALDDPSEFHGWALVADFASPRAFWLSESQVGAPVLELSFAPEPYAPADPDPPALDRGTPTHVFDAMSWLLEIDRGLQWGVGATAVDPERAALIRGRVLDRTGAPLAGVEVSVLGHPELGRRRSRGVARMIV